MQTKTESSGYILKWIWFIQFPLLSVLLKVPKDAFLRFIFQQTGNIFINNIMVLLNDKNKIPAHYNIST